jgi:hypothetical protein
MKRGSSMISLVRISSIETERHPKIYFLTMVVKPSKRSMACEICGDARILREMRVRTFFVRR